MNCCTGQCNQGRECPARCADDGSELGQLETVMIYIVIAAGLAIVATFSVLMLNFLLS